MEDKPRLARRVSRMQLVGVVEDDTGISGRVTGGVSAQTQDRLEMEDFRYNHRDSLLMALDLQAPTKTRPSQCSHRSRHRREFPCKDGKEMSPLLIQRIKSGGIQEKEQSIGWQTRW
jgi:hypothetical protein